MYKRQVKEISKRTAANYIGKASRDAYFKGRDQGTVDAISAVGGSHPHQDYKKSPERKAAMRLAHFKKYGKYDDDNPAAYKKAPGDKTAKTKPSVHTLKYRRMYGEDAVELAKKKIEREKMVDKIKHARMLDRAKVRKIKNRSTANA